MTKIHLLKQTLLVSMAMAVSLVFVALSQPASAATPLSEIKAGDLIRGESLPAVYYYGKDGFRYVFPNDKTYFTWYQNFDNVRWISDADLGTVQIGGNVTYRPGVRMIKINSDPKTYAIGEGGALQWVTSEAVAVGLYGPSWNTKIDDVPDAFFGNYKKGADLANASEFNPAAETASAENINKDKDLKAAKVVQIKDNVFGPQVLTISAGTAVKWVNKDNTKHTATGDNLKWGTGTLTQNQNFSRYFKEPGTYTYHCTYHPGMTGTIIVE